jgi:hypothetical protein
MAKIHVQTPQKRRNLIFKKRSIVLIEKSQPPGRGCTSLGGRFSLFRGSGVGVIIHKIGRIQTTVREGVKYG